MVDKLKRDEDTIDMFDGLTDLERPISKKLRNRSKNYKQNLFFAWENAVHQRWHNLMSHKTDQQVTDLMKQKELIRRYERGESKARVTDELKRRVTKYKQRS